ncbi:MAG: site-specific DNA-methyltransferase [Planctomycetota bacterium]|nr:MAG: site-specific DNA-methyltransferase [Planctomycetota bacterium]REJ92009.1 MAG: site-specific DNA-methyltransferase [Planctomycetota bacterium]REK28545.1 MAG: site-specific DNA-methyltransferase [Planctomycetota bacterium]REK39160.1 MAG: site-specific DNA-methyltransferase [Planctomycetota bacterium]
MLKHKLIHGDCLQRLRALGDSTCIFADPPDNIALDYNEFDDRRASDEYVAWLDDCLRLFIQKAGIVWVSYNAKWSFAMGMLVWRLLQEYDWLEAKANVQVYTFGQHNKHDLGNNHRPLLRLKRKDAPLYPDQIRVPSWRQLHGDKRADPRGRVPGDVMDMQYPGLGDVLDFPRVTGNSRQRCNWHPTQLHEDLVERCIKLSTLEGERVTDPFGGTGTTLRVCDRISRRCTLVEYDRTYCDKIAEENGLKRISESTPAMWGK